MPNAALASTLTLMATAMKVSGKMICIMAKARRIMLMAAAIKESGQLMRRMEKESLRTVKGKSLNKHGPKE